MRFAHLADLHCKEEAYELVRAAIEAVIAEHGRKPFDAILIAGDLWHGAIMNTARARFADFLDLLRRLADCAPVAVIYGTPPHDTEGSLEVLETIDSEHGIKILRPGIPYYLDGSGGFFREEHVEGGDSALFFGVPEPNKKWLLANAGATGKDDSDASVRDALRGLLLGLGGMRQQHSDLPCILLYHGQIAGAKSGTGFGAEAGSGLAVTRDDLSTVGADYYALGDIHEPQQIGDLPAYYPGSVYSANFGETHKPGCNIVEITRGTDPEDLFGAGPGQTSVTVDRLTFAMPQRKKVACEADALTPGLLACLSGFEGWLEITATREQADALDPDALLALALQKGALPGSRVTLNVLPTETVRAGEIIKKKALRDKVQVWAESSELAVHETVLAKADDLEREAAVGAGGQGAHIRIDRLRLRGAIGIWKKSRKDEIDIDFEGLGPGVLALVGANGYGKTTILENCHPWASLLTREGTLKDHFRLKDSARELWFTDQRSGWRYRALINIRADIVSGTAEYYLFRDQGDGRGELPLDNVNGRKEPYEQAIGELFGSLEMYLQTAFVTQRPNKYAPDLGQATQGQRKTLFAELAGIDYLEGYAKAAKARGDALEGEVRTLDATVAAAQDVDEVLARLAAEVAEAQSAETAALDGAHAAEGEVQRLGAERATLAERVAASDRAAARRAQVEREIQEIDRALAAIEAEITGFRKAAEGRAAAETELERIKALEEKRASLLAEKAKVDEANAKAAGEHRVAYVAVTNQRAKLQAELDGKRRASGKADQAVAVARAKLAAPVADICPTCGQALPADRLEALAHAHEEAQTAVDALELEAGEAREAVAHVEGALASIIDPPAFEAQSFPGAAGLAEVEGELEWVNKAGTERILEDARTADARIAAAAGRQQEAGERKGRLQVELATLAPDLAAEALARQALAAAETALRAASERLIEERSAAAAARATIQAAERSRTDAEARLAKRDAALAERGTKAEALADWRLLERAVGKDGIQALELDALAPSTADVANKLLGVFSARHRIEFRTTRMAGSGKRTKQVEDFEIFILDTETGDEQTIDSLSGGEAVWIRKALYDAFAIIRARNTDRRFLTVFLDEADGALDPEARKLYLLMLEAAHRESGRFQTIIVTHSSELQAMVERTIDVAALGPREAKAEEVAA